MSEVVFYSWQSDLPNRCNRGAIEAALERALKELNRDASLQAAPRLDKDTSGVPGSPDIAATILAKIDKATAFVADVSIVQTSSEGRSVPNPNVLVELGYALKALGQERIIMVFNEEFGAVEDLPFDLRFKRVLTYRLSEHEAAAGARSELASKLEAALRLVINHLRDSEQDERLGTYTSTLAAELISFLFLAEQMGNRSLNPWFDAAQFQFGSDASTFRDLASAPEATELGITDELRRLGKLIDEVTGHISALGRENWNQYLGKVEAAVNQALQVKAKAVDVLPLDEESKAAIRNQLSGAARRAAGLSIEAQELLSEEGYPRWEEVRDRASEVGKGLLRASYYPSISEIADPQVLRSIGTQLHQLELIEQRTHDRREVDRCLNEVVRLAEELSELQVRT